MSADKRRRPGYRETTPSTPGMFPPQMSRNPSSVSLSRGPSSGMWGANDRTFSPGLGREDQFAEFHTLSHYHLNVPDDDNEVRHAQLNRESPFYATNTIQDVREDQLLPYKTESIREQYMYLCHIVEHIYIAIKSEDLKGNISVGATDLEKARMALFSGSEAEFASEEEAVETFETLTHTQSEADEDDEEEDDEDSFYESDYSSDDDESAFVSTPVSKVANHSAAIIGLKYWTKELKNLLTIGVIPPAYLASALIKVYYGVILSRGQAIDIEFFTGVIIALLKEREVLQEYGLQLDWRPVFRELEATLPTPNGSTRVTDDLRFRRLVRFALTINIFFEDSCVPEVMAKIMDRFTNQTVATAFIQMAVMLPVVFKDPLPDGSFDPTDIRTYLPIFFSCWKTQRSNKEISCLVSVLANTAESALTEGSKHPGRITFGKFGIFTHDQFEMILTQLTLSTRMALGEKQAKYVKLLVDIVVHSITSQCADDLEGVLDMLQTYANSITTLVHPSNSGSWSAILSQTIKRFATTYHLRLLQERVDKSLVAKHSDDFSGLAPEYRLSKHVTTRFIDALLPLVQLGIQSKSSSQRRRYVTALSTFCFISPQQTLDAVLLDIYSSFDSVNSTHRIGVVLRELSALARYMVQLPVYRVHLPRLLSMLLPGVDSNDPQKTISTINLVKLVATVIPFSDLTDGDGDGGLTAVEFTTSHLAYLEARYYRTSPNRDQLTIYGGDVPEEFQFDPELELSALKSASSSFSEFVGQFCDACFKYLEYSPSVEGDEGIETRASSLIPQSFDALVESMSDEIFAVMANRLFEYITHNVKHKVALVFSNLTELIVRRDPEYQLPRFMDVLLPQILEELKEGAGTTRAQETLSKDALLVWYLKILCGVVLGSSSYLIPYLDQLYQLIAKCSSLKGEASYSVSLLINSIMTSVACSRPLERRFVSPEWLAKNGNVTEALWGGLQFDPSRFSDDNLHFKWYQPSADEVGPLVDFFESSCRISIDRLNAFLADFKEDQKISLDTSDQVAFDITLLDGAVTGMCALFDPAFKPQLLDPAKALQTGPPALSQVPSSASLVSMAGGPQLQEPAPSLSKPTPKSHVMLHDNPSASSVLDSKFGQSIDREGLPDSDIDMDDLVVPDSEMPTRSATPEGGFEAVDASLTNRSSNLYTFGYYYGSNNFAKLSDPSYIKLHKTREEVGHVLHSLAVALINQDGSIELMSSVIQAIAGWLKNCGYFSSNNPIFVDNIHLLTLLDCPGTNCPYSRVVFGARTAIYHCNRMNISRCTRLPTDTDKLLIRDLVTFAASSYRVTSYHAISILTSVLSKIMNCTSLVFGIFSEWDAALEAKDEDRIKNILRLFSLRKFRGLAEKSSHQFKPYENLLVRSIEFDEFQITSLALKLYGSIKKYIRVPCQVCIIDWSLVENIRPPTPDVDSTIDALQLAKQSKKKQYVAVISRLITRTIKRTTKHLYWKFLLKALELISNLQTHFELPLNGEVLNVLAKSVNGLHPLVSKKCVIWMASILDVVNTRGLYGYDLTKIMSVDPPEPGTELVTSQSASEFFVEMSNFDHPHFFVDSKFWVPTLAWGGNFKVIDANYNPKSLGLNRVDERSIARFGKHITKQWLQEILDLHVEESESTTSFLPGVAYFINSAMVLSLYGYTPDFRYQELYEIADSIYKKDDKATHLAVSEIYTGMLLATRTFPEECKNVDAQISGKLSTLFASEITQSTLSIWKIFSWWVPAHFDLRRCPKLVDTLCNFDIDATGNISPFLTFCRVSLFKSYMSALLNRYHDFDDATRRLFAVLAHPYHIVSENVAAMLFDTLLYTATKQYESFDKYLEASSNNNGGMGLFPYELSATYSECFDKYLQRIDELQPATKGLSPQELVKTDYMYSVRGLYYLLICLLKTSHGDLIFPFWDRILKLWFELDNVKEALKLMDLHPMIPFFLLASVRYSKEETEHVVDTLCDLPVQSPTLSQTQRAVSLNESYYVVRRLMVTDEQRNKLLKQCVRYLFSKYAEVREKASEYLSLTVHSFVASQMDALILKYNKRFTKIVRSYKKVKGRKMTSVELAQLHGATLGLGALVQAFPYSTPPPPWMPGVLSTLANRCSSIDGLVGRTAKDILSKFKKTRQDTWHIDSKFFTQEQLEDLEGVLWKSYFI